MSDKSDAASATGPTKYTARRTRHPLVAVGTAIVLAVTMALAGIYTASSAQAVSVTGYGPGDSYFNSSNGYIQGFNAGTWSTTAGTAVCINPDKPNPLGKSGWSDPQTMSPGYALSQGYTVNATDVAQLGYLMWAHGSGSLSTSDAIALKVATMYILYGSQPFTMYGTWSTTWNLWGSGIGYMIANQEGVLDLARSWVNEAEANYVTWDSNNSSYIAATTNGAPLAPGGEMRARDPLTATWTLPGIPAGYTATWTLTGPDGTTSTQATSDANGTFTFSQVIATPGPYSLQASISNVPPNAPQYMYSASSGDQDLMLVGGGAQNRQDPFDFTVRPRLDILPTSQVPDPSINKGSVLADTITLTPNDSEWITDDDGNPVTLLIEAVHYGQSSAPYAVADTAPAGTPVLGTSSFEVTLPTEGTDPYVVEIPPSARLTSPTSGYGSWVWSIIVDDQNDITKELLWQDRSDQFGVESETVLTRMDLTITSDATDTATGGSRAGQNGPGLFQNPGASPYDTATICLKDDDDLWVTTRDGQPAKLVLDGTYYGDSPSSWHQNGTSATPPASATAYRTTQTTVTLPSAGNGCATYDLPVPDVTIPASQYGNWVWSILKASQTPEVSDLISTDATDTFGQEKETIATRMAPQVHSHAVEAVTVEGTPTANADGSYAATFTRQQKQTDGTYQDVTETGTVYKTGSLWVADTTPQSRVDEPLKDQTTVVGDRVWVTLPDGAQWLNQWGTSTPVPVTMRVDLYHAATIPAAPIDPASADGPADTWNLTFTQAGVSQIVAHEITGDQHDEGFWGFVQSSAMALQPAATRDYMVGTADTLTSKLWEDGLDSAGKATASEDPETIVVLKRDAKISTTASAFGTTNATYAGPDVFLVDDVWQVGWPDGPDDSTMPNAVAHGQWRAVPGYAPDISTITVELWAVSGDFGPTSCTADDPNSRLVATRAAGAAAALPAANTWLGKNQVSGSLFKTDEVNVSYTFVVSHPGDDRVMPYRSLCGEPSETVTYREVVPEYITQAVTAGDEQSSDKDTAQAMETGLVATPGSRVSDVLHVWTDETVDTLDPLQDLSGAQLRWDVYYKPVPPTHTDTATGRISVTMPAPVPDEDTGQWVYTDAVCSDEYLLTRTDSQPMTDVGTYTSPAVTVPDTVGGLLYFQEVVTDTNAPKDADGNPAEIHRGQCGVARETVTVDKDVPGFITQAVVPVQSDPTAVTVESAKAQTTASEVLGGGPAVDVLAVDAGSDDTIDWARYSVSWKVYFTPDSDTTDWTPTIVNGRSVYRDAVCDEDHLLATLPEKTIDGSPLVTSDEFDLPNRDGLVTVQEMITTSTPADGWQAPSASVRLGVCGLASESVRTTEYVPEFGTQMVTTPDQADQVTPETAEAVTTALPVEAGSQVVDVLMTQADPVITSLDWAEYQVHWDMFFQPSPQATAVNTPYEWEIGADDDTGRLVYTQATCDATTKIGSTDEVPVTGTGTIVSPGLDVPDQVGLYLVQEVVTSTTRTVPTVDENGETVQTPLVLHTGRCGLVSETALTTLTPTIDVEKWSTDESWQQDALGDHDSSDKAKELTAKTDEAITFTITNNGPEPLVMIEVTDTLINGNNPVENLTCDFTQAVTSTHSGITFPDLAADTDGWEPYSSDTVEAQATVPTSGTAWNGPFLVGASFDCTGTVPGLQAGQDHADRVSVTGFGQYSGKPVTDTDDWWGKVPAPAMKTGGSAVLDQNNLWPVAILAGIVVLAGAAVIIVTVRRRHHSKGQA